jgi:glycosyltransferase involved in cell wall biosynthesis
MLNEGDAPLVSIVIPCYNQARFLSEAIESALIQTHPRVEVIVVDDGSTDNTAEVVARFPRVRRVWQDNRGVAEARNAGFRASRGEYVVFVDADDRLASNAVEAHLACFAKHPETGFVVGDIERITEGGAYRGSSRWPALEGDQYEHLLEVKHIGNTIAVMFRRLVLENVGGFKRYFSPAEDYEILLRAAQVFRSAHHSTVVAQYRRHATNTSRKGVVMLQAMRRVMRSQRVLVKGKPRLEAALCRGEIHWRDFFGAVTVKQIYAHLGQGELWAAAQAVIALLLHVRGRLIVLPWKYRRRAMAAARRRLVRLVNLIGMKHPSHNVVIR